MRLSQHKLLPHFWPFSHWVRDSICQAGLSSGQTQPPLAWREVAKSKYPIGRLLSTWWLVFPKNQYNLSPFPNLINDHRYKHSRLFDSLGIWIFEEVNGITHVMRDLPMWGLEGLSLNSAIMFCTCVGNNAVCITPSQLLYTVRLKRAILRENDCLKRQWFLLWSYIAWLCWSAVVVLVLESH